jgi:taurine dioxygenase
MDVEPIAGGLGAVVSGIDLSADLEQESIQALRQALARHLVIFLPRQSLDPERLLAFTRRIGQPMQLPYVEALPEHPDVIAVLKEADEQRISVFGGDWHSDYSFLAEPPMGSVLYADTVPETGGDTLWANTIAAHAALSDGMKSLLGPLRAMHSGHVYGAERPPVGIRTSRSIGISRGNPDADQEQSHPLVRRHEPTGQPALFVNPIYTTRIADMTEAESQPLLAFLYAHATRPEFCCRWHWRQGDVALWDNRATLHYAINDYDGHRRLLYRTAIAGERPTGFGR